MGLTASRDDFPREKVRIHQLRISAATSLKNLLDTYDFYTPALVHLRVRLFDRDPYLNFVEEYGTEVIPISIRFNRAVFRGMSLGAEKSWNYYLYGMEKEHFQAYRQWFGSLAFTDREANRVSRIREKVIEIADPLYFERAVILPTEIPLIPVVVFCLDTNHGCWYVETGANPLLDLPEVKFTHDVFPDTRIFASAILGDQSDPYGVVDEAKGVDPVKELEDRVRQDRKEQQDEPG